MERDELGPDLAWLQFLHSRLLLAGGDKHKAVEALKTALRMAEAIGIPDELLYTRTLVNYASTAQDVGELGESLSAGEHALRLLRRRDDLAYLNIRSICLLNLGVLFRQLNLPDRAKSAYMEVIALDQRRHAAPDVLAEDFNNLGNVLVEDLEDVQGGLRWLQDSLRQHQLFRAERGKDARSYGITLDSLGKAYRLLGKTEESQAFYRKSLEYDQKINDTPGYVQTLNNIAEELEEQGRYGEARRTYQDAKRIIERHPGIDPEVVWPTIDGLGRMDSIDGDLGAAAAKYDQAISIVEDLSHSLSRYSEERVFRAGHTVPYYDRARLALRNRQWADMFRYVEGARSTLAYPPSTQKRSAVALETLQRSLGEHDLAVEYLFGDKNDPVIALVVTRMKAFGMELARGQEIDSAAVAYADALMAGNRGTATYAVARISAQLFPDPLRDAITTGGVTRIIVIPDVSIGRIPFESLKLDQKATPLLEVVTVSSAPSLSWWSSAQSAPAPAYRAPLLAIGEPLTRPDLGCGSSDGLTGGLHFPVLTHTKGEIETIANYAGATAVQLRGGRARVADWFRQNPEQFGILHFATHGHATGSLESSFLLFGCGDGPDLLTGSAIEGLRLNGQIVVLSACDTHSGRPLRGEGVDSLASAFFRAGARSVIATRWSIRDDVSEAFMSAFYRHLSHGVTVAQAFHGTQIGILRDFPDLGNASAFSLLGVSDIRANLSPGWTTKLRDFTGMTR